MSLGKTIRLERILHNGRMVVIPMDDGLLDGPEGGLRDMRDKVRQIVEGGADAMLGFKGLLKRCYTELAGTPFVMNITASTGLSYHTRKTLVGSVEDALIHGADAVGVHVNVSSEYEREMITNLGVVSEACDRWGMPLLALMYPRKEKPDGKDDNYLELKQGNPEEYAKLVRHAVRIGVELGADIIKTHYTGSVETFRTVVESTSGVPVVIAGGPKVSDKEALENVYGAVQAGGAGICFGRNGFNRDNTADFVKALREIVHEGKTVNEVVCYLG
ncbi:MAG: fructose-bisphosphate aldolase [Nanoarchaeota archaeon]|nr:fructose-bisphosphate aldolase [Nanoarchaeota archaeon]